MVSREGQGLSLAGLVDQHKKWRNEAEQGKPLTQNLAQEQTLSMSHCIIW